MEYPSLNDRDTPIHELPICAFFVPALSLSEIHTDSHPVFAPKPLSIKASSSICKGTPTGFFAPDSFSLVPPRSQPKCLSSQPSSLWTCKMTFAHLYEISHPTLDCAWSLTPTGRLTCCLRGPRYCTTHQPTARLSTICAESGHSRLSPC